MNEKTIILVRHCESMANDEGKLCGTTDASLSEFGELARYATGYDLLFRKLPIDALYCSMLRRAYQTAQGIQHYYPNLNIKRNVNLNEMCFGEGEGMLFTEVLKSEGWKKYGYPAGFEGQETKEDVVERAKKAIHEISLKEKDARFICMVTHGMLIKVLLQNIGKVSKNFLTLDNGSYIILKYNLDTQELKIISK